VTIDKHAWLGHELKDNRTLINNLAYVSWELGLCGLSSHDSLASQVSSVLQH